MFAESKKGKKSLFLSKLDQPNTFLVFFFLSLGLFMDLCSIQFYVFKWTYVKYVFRPCLHKKSNDQ